MSRTTLSTMERLLPQVAGDLLPPGYELMAADGFLLERSMVSDAIELRVMQRERNCFGVGSISGRQLMASARDGASLVPLMRAAVQEAVHHCRAYEGREARAAHRAISRLVRREERAQRRCWRHEDCREDHGVGAACYALRRGWRWASSAVCQGECCVGPVEPEERRWLLAMAQRVVREGGRGLRPDQIEEIARIQLEYERLTRRLQEAGDLMGNGVLQTPEVERRSRG